MSKKNPTVRENIRLGKLVHGGQAIAEVPSGKKIFVWGGLPGELVNVIVTKKKGSYFEGVVTEVIEPSSDRISPEEPKSYLSTSPWQIINYAAELKHKDAILREAFDREKVSIPEWSEFETVGEITGYRNKMEFGFWGDEEGLQLAHYVRGTHGKQKVDGSVLTSDAINDAAQSVLQELRRLDVWGGDLKTVVLRSSTDKKAVAALFMKKELDMGEFKLPDNLKGIDFYYSNPDSPASAPTKKLYSLGDIKLSDSIMGKDIMYDVMSFFQVNLPVFEKTLETIKSTILDGPIVDFYSGVGTIGIVLGAELLVESDEPNIAMARLNAKGTDTKVVHATSETALDYIAEDKILIVDPPRAGLHMKVIDRIAEVRPPQIIYLSCNPSTQARDIRLLSEFYDVIHAQGFNFFPRTPHIESLFVLKLK